MGRIAPMLFVSLALLAAGCGSEKDEGTTTAPLKLLPDAKTSAEWAQRAVRRFLRPLNRDLEVLNTLNTPATRLYITTGQPATLRVIDTRMKDLSRCGDKLVVIGPPPEQDPEFRGVHDYFRRACRNYEDVADKVLQAVPLLSSGREDVIERGTEVLRDANDPSRRAATLLGRAIEIAQKRPEFRAAGLQPTPQPKH
jgi:hypothetical protein